MAVQTNVALKAVATQIKNETLAGANTATRVGALLEDLVDSKEQVITILPTSKGGTGLGSFTATNYFRALNASTLEMRTPAQVLADIGAQAAGSYAAAAHVHAATDITSGTLATARGGTGLTGFVINNYVRAVSATALEMRTPAQVLSDIGAQAAGSYAAASHTHAASAITGATFGTGDYVFPTNLDINGQVASPTHNKGNITGATTVSFNDGNIQRMTLTGNVTFTFSNPKSGGSYQLIISQDATGGRTITWPTMHWGGKTVPTLTGTLNSKDIITITYDGATYNATILKNVGI